MFTSLAALNQLSAPNNLRARIVALYTMSHFMIYGTAASIAGAIAQAQSIRASLVVGGVACFVAAIATMRLAVPASFETVS